MGCMATRTDRTDTAMKIGLLDFPPGVSPSPLPTIEHTPRRALGSYSKLDMEPNIFDSSFQQQVDRHGQGGAAHPLSYSSHAHYGHYGRSPQDRSPHSSHGNQSSHGARRSRQSPEYYQPYNSNHNSNHNSNGNTTTSTFSPRSTSTTATPTSASYFDTHGSNYSSAEMGAVISNGDIKLKLDPTRRRGLHAKRRENRLQHQKQSQSTNTNTKQAPSYTQANSNGSSSNSSWNRKGSSGMVGNSNVHNSQHARSQAIQGDSNQHAHLHPQQGQPQLQIRYSGNDGIKDGHSYHMDPKSVGSNKTKNSKFSGQSREYQQFNIKTSGHGEHLHTAGEPMDEDSSANNSSGLNNRYMKSTNINEEQISSRNKKKSRDTGNLSGVEEADGEGEDENDTGDLETEGADEETKRKSFLERNRVAALKCRRKRRERLQLLQEKLTLVSTSNDQLEMVLEDMLIHLTSLYQTYGAGILTDQQGYPGFQDGWILRLFDPNTDNEVEARKLKEREYAKLRDGADNAMDEDPDSTSDRKRPRAYDEEEEFMNRSSNNRKAMNQREKSILLQRLLTIFPIENFETPANNSNDKSSKRRGSSAKTDTSSKAKKKTANNASMNSATVNKMLSFNDALVRDDGSLKSISYFKPLVREILAAGSISAVLDGGHMQHMGNMMMGNNTNANNINNNSNNNNGSSINPLSNTGSLPPMLGKSQLGGINSVFSNGPSPTVGYMSQPSSSGLDTVSMQVPTSVTNNNNQIQSSESQQQMQFGIVGNSNGGSSNNGYSSYQSYQSQPLNMSQQQQQQQGSSYQSYMSTNGPQSYPDAPPPHGYSHGYDNMHAPPPYSHHQHYDQNSGFMRHI